MAAPGPGAFRALPGQVRCWAHGHFGVPLCATFPGKLYLSSLKITLVVSPFCMFYFPQKFSLKENKPPFLCHWKVAGLSLLSVLVFYSCGQMTTNWGLKTTGLSLTVWRPGVRDQGVPGLHPL